MKKIILALILTGAFVTSKAQLKLPANVKAAFEAKFPTATKVKWGKENATTYEATFMEKGIKHSANINAQGAWLETESAIEFYAIPAAVKAAFETQHNGAVKKEIAMIEKADGTIVYEIEIKIKGKNVDCLYNADGTTFK
jgi:Putative beta-lactamase-inhibitor-like, PepSY-like